MTNDLSSIKQRSFLSPWLEDVSCAQMESVGVQGGFSGAVIWKVSIEGQNYCLRRWPQVHPTMDGLAVIHGLLFHTKKSGFEIVPAPLPTRSGKTFFLNEQHLWELAPWMPGEASYLDQPSKTKLEAAARCLAKFHKAAENFSHAGVGQKITQSSGLRQRLAILQELQQGGLDKLWQATRLAVPNQLQQLAFELLEGIDRPLAKITGRLVQIADSPLPLQWCLQDVRHDHILFTDDRVTGLIDFGAVAVESVAGDLARLLGSMVNDDAQAWRTGVEAYCRVRPLTEDQQRAMVGFDEGGTLCSAANWVRWLFVDRKTFPQMNAVVRQLQWLSTRLRALESRSGASMACGW